MKLTRRLFLKMTGKAGAGAALVATGALKANDKVFDVVEPHSAGSQPSSVIVSSLVSSVDCHKTAPAYEDGMLVVDTRKLKPIASQLTYTAPFDAMLLGAAKPDPVFDVREYSMSIYADSNGLDVLRLPGRKVLLKIYSNNWREYDELLLAEFPAVLTASEIVANHNEAMVLHLNFKEVV